MKSDKIKKSEATATSEDNCQTVENLDNPAEESVVPLTRRQNTTDLKETEDKDGELLEQNADANANEEEGSSVPSQTILDTKGIQNGSSEEDMDTSDVADAIVNQRRKSNEELLKDRLTPCREICPFLLDLFIWRKDGYPCILVSVVSLIFGFIWYYDPSVVTAFSVLGLIFTIGDYFLPVVSKSVSSPEGWNSEKEKKFSIFVNRIAYYSVQVWNFQVTLEEWKKEYPNAYSSTIIVSLLFLAWIGNTINNLFLTYLLVLFLALLPGLLHRRIIQVYVSKAILCVSNMIGAKTKKN